MSYVKLVARDFAGLSRTVGIGTALKWLGLIAINLKDVLRRRDLIGIDRRMGVGPFRVRYGPGVSFRIGGFGAFSGIREMYARDTYLHGGLLAVEDGDIVVDLGSNMGNFTNLALAHGRNVKVYAVEPSADLNGTWQRSLSLNTGFRERADIVSAFVGQMGGKQDEAQGTDAYAGSGWMSEDDLISRFGLSRIDFLKCDIEGGEFGLLNPASKILQMTRKLAIEVHAFAGDVAAFLAMLESEGFALRHVQRDPDGTVTALASRD